MDEKCSARMLTLLAALLCTTPWCRSGEIPELSLPVDLIPELSLPVDFVHICRFILMYNLGYSDT